MTPDDSTGDLNPPVPDQPGDAAATLADNRVVLGRTIDTRAGPVTVLLSAPCFDDQAAIEAAAYSASNELARLAALATDTGTEPPHNTGGSTDV